MGRPRNERIVDENGKQWHVCPICGEKCSEYHWRNYKRCGACNDALEKGATLQGLKQLRTNELQQQFSDTKKLTNAHSTDNKTYDFKTRFPVGIYVKPLKNNLINEAEILKSTYYQYFEDAGHLPEFVSVINPILINTIETYRNNDHMAKCTTLAKVGEKKVLSDLINKATQQITTSVNLLQSLKMTRRTNSGVKLTDEFKKILEYYHDNDQAYSAVAECPECNNRIIMKSYFKTFKTRYLELVENIYKQMLDMKEIDRDTVHAFRDRIVKTITDDAVKETYVKHHMRNIEKTLL